MSRVITGPRFVLEALRADASISVIYAEHRRADEALRQAAARASVRIEEKTREELDELTDGVRHQGVVALASDYAYLSLDELLQHQTEKSLLVALDELTDPQNFGAIIRSAVAFEVGGIIIGRHRSVQVTPAVVRASAGATEHAKIAQVTNLQKALVTLQEQGYWVIGLDGEAEQELSTITQRFDHAVLVVGSEGRGLGRLVRKRCDMLARIAHRGPIDSLNASVATGIAIYEASRWLEKPK